MGKVGRGGLAEEGLQLLVLVCQSDPLLYVCEAVLNLMSLSLKGAG